MPAEAPFPLPIRPVEPDIAAVPVAVQIDPSGVLDFDRGADFTDVMWTVPPNALVFRSQTLLGPVVGSSHKRRLTVPDPTRITAYWKYNAADPLIPFGVSIDGNLSGADSRRWPVERGRLAVSVSGTVTMIAHPADIDNLEVGDKLCVGKTAHENGLVEHPTLQLPTIQRWNNYAKLAQIEQSLDEATDEESRQKLAQKHKAAGYFGIALELGHCEIRVLLTP